MIFLSILAKTCAVMLARFHPLWAAVAWALGLAADWFALKKKPTTTATRSPGVPPGRSSKSKVPSANADGKSAKLHPSASRLVSGFSAASRRLAPQGAPASGRARTTGVPPVEAPEAPASPPVNETEAPRTPAAQTPISRRLLSLLLFNLAALVIGFAAAAACDYAAMRWKLGIPLVAHLLAWFLNLLDVPAAAAHGNLYLTTMAGPLETQASIDHLALRTPVVFLALGAAWMLWSQARLLHVFRNLAILSALLLAAVVVRAGCVILLFLALSEFVGYETEELPFRPFAEEAVSFWTWLPFLLVLWPVAQASGLLPNPRRRDEVPLHAPLSRFVKWAGIPILLAAFCFVLWKPVGAPKDGRMVIDTFHTQWSRTDRPYDRDWYGADSGYNYAVLKRMFELFYPVQELKTRITPESLSGASMLVIYTPDKRYSEEEINAIRAFVGDGGGLMVIGDHTNVFGSTSNLNELCADFGFQFRDDVLFDLDADFHQLIDAPKWPSRFWHGMSFFKLRGPCSIRPTSLGTRCIYQVGHSKDVRAIYSVNNFYPPPHDDPKMKTGTFCVAAASHYGSGRVLAWADSTVFSNFEIFYPGKYEFLLNSGDWLNHRDNLAVGILRKIIGIGLVAGIGFLLATRRRPRFWLGTAVAAILAGAAASWSTAWWEARQASFPTPKRPADWVFFAADSHDPGYHLRDFLTKEPYNQRYEVFVQWVLRTGAYSGFHLTGPDHLPGLHEFLRGAENQHTAAALIVRKPDDLGELDALAEKVAAPGEPVLLMFASTVSAEAATKALQSSGLVRDAGALTRIAAAWPKGQTDVSSGNRRFLVVAGAERFSDQNMGISEKVKPNPQQRARFAEAFAIIDQLFGKKKR